MLKDKLKPCPFCKRKPYIIGTDEGLWKGFCIRCDCGCSLGYEVDRDACPEYKFETAQQVIPACNTRAK